MERRRKMDLTGSTRIRRSLIRFSLVIFCFAGLAAAQASPNSDATEKARQLIEKEQWQEVVSLAESTPHRSAELNYLYGTALAHLEHWPQAHAAFKDGEQRLLGDARFPVELAGVDFKLKKYADAASHLRRALHLNPQDSYANEFLATVYFLQGNLEAALKYWNRVKKPKIANVLVNPKPRVNAALLDHAFTFSPASILQVSDLLASQSRVQGLGIFSTYNFDLKARDDGQFDLLFRNHESNGFGSNKWETLLNIFHDLPEQSINLDYDNYRNKAINFSSMYRWDAEKRRVQAAVSAPLGLDAKRRVSAGLDLRGENWDIRESTSNFAPVLGRFNMRREAIHAQITTLQATRWSWSATAELSHRDFRDIDLGTVLTPDLLSRGYQLKQTTSINADLWRFPEHKFTMIAGVSSDLGRTWSAPDHTFEKLQASLRLHWLPKATGDDYEFQHQFRAGKTWGSLPFDELFTLGGIGDNPLVMRGHISTFHGRKGRSPLGENYFLSNWEVDKNVFSTSLFTVKLGPFIDTGKITDPHPGIGSDGWLWDTGAQAKFRALGVRFAVVYGKDLRTGNNAFFVTLLNY
ncbi:MAG TPA: tetratricopeptide repeat protein [Terriglobales bacterium]|nr:tetratricopeptide repeat protein [Terriglobales bacterium]